MMTSEDFLRRLGWAEKDFQPLRQAWERLTPQAENTVPEFYTEPFIRHYGAFLKCGDGIIRQMIQAGELASTTPEGRLFGQILYDAGLLQPRRINGFSFPLPVCFGEKAGLVQLLVALGSFPLIEEAHRRFGLPRSCTENLFLWLAGTIPSYQAAHGGIPGHSICQFHWLRGYIEGEVFRIGRLEFERTELPSWGAAIFRNRKTGRSMALSRSRRFYAADGMPANEWDAGVTQAWLRYEDGCHTGIPFDPVTGLARLDQPVRLDAAEWECLTPAGEGVLSMHIPGGGGLKPELVIDSIREAVPFFRKYFSFRPRVLVCGSWILNPAWRELLPESNIARFGQWGSHFLQLPPDGSCGLFFVFGRSDGDLASYPAETSLHQAFHRLHRENRPIMAGCMYICTDDIPDLTPGFYGRQN